MINNSNVIFSDGFCITNYIANYLWYQSQLQNYIFFFNFYFIFIKNIWMKKNQLYLKKNYNYILFSVLLKPNYPFVRFFQKIYICLNVKTETWYDINDIFLTNSSLSFISIIVIDFSFCLRIPYQPIKWASYFIELTCIGKRDQ